MPYGFLALAICLLLGAAGSVPAASAAAPTPATDPMPETPQLAKAQTSQDGAQTAPARARPEPPANPTGRLALIQERGRLIVGVKSDYPPWGMVNADGELVGLISRTDLMTALEIIQTSGGTPGDLPLRPQGN